MSVTFSFLGEKAFWAWVLSIGLTVGVIWGCLRLVSKYPVTKIHTGTNIVFSTDSSHFLMILSDKPVEFSAAYGDYFVIRRLNGDSITPTDQTPPIGWTSDHYFKADPRLISGGKWITEKGLPGITITSQIPIEVQEVPTESYISSTELGIGLGGFIAWLIGLMVLGGLGFYN